LTGNPSFPTIVPSLVALTAVSKTERRPR
jgi:hypothetical protein